MSVTFQPTSSGAKSATLTIASSIGSAVVALAGSGQADGHAGDAGRDQRVPRPRTERRQRRVRRALQQHRRAGRRSAATCCAARTATGTVSTRATVPAGTMIPARGHYLFINSAAGGYSGASRWRTRPTAPASPTMAASRSRWPIRRRSSIRSGMSARLGLQGRYAAREPRHHEHESQLRAATRRPERQSAGHGRQRG